MDDARYRLTHETTFDAFCGALEAEEAKQRRDPEKRRLPSMHGSALGGHARLLFDELLGKEVAAHEEQAKKQAKKEARYHELLSDYYYRSDHISTSWKDATYDMRKRSAFLDMDEPGRRVLFEKHLESLAKKMGKVPALEHAGYTCFDFLPRRAINSHVPTRLF